MSRGGGGGGIKRRVEREEGGGGGEGRGRWTEDRIDGAEVGEVLDKILDQDVDLLGLLLLQCQQFLNPKPKSIAVKP